MSVQEQMTSATMTEPPLVVDMDGTLLNTDTLFEGVAALLRNEPLAAFALPVWAMGGKAAFKREIANRIQLDVEYLPYEERLLRQLRTQRGARRIILCTAADHRFAGAVASHLGIFDEVIATHDDVNLRAAEKARVLVERFGAGGFDYAGNDVQDLEVFSQARRAIVVNPTAGLERRRSSIGNVAETVHGIPAFSWRALLRAMRPDQWIKNLLVFVPMLATLQVSRLSVFIPSALAFVSFSLVASSVYLLNDLLDLGADRRHPRKRRRPLAAGQVPLSQAMLLIPVLLLAGFAIAALISQLFVISLVAYYVCTTLYTFWLKRVVLLDTLVLAGLYTLRILAGAAAIAVVPSFWLLAFSMFFFLSLALAKRHAELVEMTTSRRSSVLHGRSYRAEDVALLMSQGSASGYAAVLVLALYIQSDAVHAHYSNPEIIWLICPLLLYWINKLWLNAQRREIDEDPLVWAVTNRVSRGIGALSVALLLLARWLPDLF